MTTSKVLTFPTVLSMIVAHDEGYLPTFSLRYAAPSTLKTFNQVFVLLEVF